MVVFFFYVLSLILVLAALGVVLSRNPVHSIFFLILVFLLGSSLLFFLDLEFLAFIFVIIYVGAIAVLFLFIVMMLNVKLVELKLFFYTYLPVGILILTVFFLEFFFFVGFYSYSSFQTNLSHAFFVEQVYSLTVIELLGVVIYSYYSLGFIFCGFILFLATLASVALTFKGSFFVYKFENIIFKNNVKSVLRPQVFFEQYEQDYESRIFLCS
jgi:NADH-quinone oxidoreductase subunit J